MRNPEATYKAAFYSAAIISIILMARIIYLIYKYFTLWRQDKTNNN